MYTRSFRLPTKSMAPRVRYSSVINGPSATCSERKFYRYFAHFYRIYFLWRVYSHEISFSKLSFFFLPDRYMSVVRFLWRRNRFTLWFYTLWSYWMFSRPVDIFNGSHRTSFPSRSRTFPNSCILFVLFRFFFSLFYFQTTSPLISWSSALVNIGGRILYSHTLCDLYSRNFVLFENILDLRTVITQSKPFPLNVRALYPFNTPVIVFFDGRSKVLTWTDLLSVFCYCDCIILNNVNFTSNMRTFSYYF